MTALLSVLVFAWVLLMGELANFDVYSRTAFALGVMTVMPVFLLTTRVERRG